MMNTLNVHSPHRASLHVIALKGLLMLRKGEQWSWVPNHATADVWVLDALKTSSAELTDLVQSYQSCTNKPTVIYLTDGKKTSPHAEWLSIRAPVHVTKLFQLLDEHLPEKTTTKATVTTVLRSAAKHEWVFDRALLESRTIQLTQWPNITRYGHELKYVQACAFLLAGHRGYSELMRLELNDEELKTLLSDAHQQGFLVANPPLSRVAPETASSNIIPFQAVKKRSLNFEPKDFFHKMMKRFAFS